MHTELLARIYFNESPIGHCLASVDKGAPNHDVVMVGRTDTTNSDGRVCECVRAYVRASNDVHAYVRDVFAIYDDNILPRLIMIIIKIIILSGPISYESIRHTDDFPSTGIPGFYTG